MPEIAMPASPRDVDAALLQGSTCKRIIVILEA